MSETAAAMLAAHVRPHAFALPVRVRMPDCGIAAESAQVYLVSPGANVKRWIYAAAVLLAGAPALVVAADGPVPPPDDVDLAREMLRQLVAIDTTHAKGSTRAAETVRAWLLRAGFDERDLVLVAPADKPTTGNLVIRYRGTGKDRPVLFLGHLDVVDARREDWSVDPFVLTERDGWYYGRGTVDMKNGVAALAATLVRLKRERFVPERDLIVAFTADEEAGGDANGPAFLLKDRRELVDASVVVNLDGGGGATIDGQRRYFEIGTSEKTYVTYTFETTSPGGHGSLPGPDNAIYRLGAALAKVEAYRFPVRLTATTRAAFAAFADLEPGPDSADMRAVAKEPMDAAAAERLSRTVRYNAQLRTTCVATLISGGHAENALPQRAKATVQCRMLPGDSAENVQAALIAAVADPQVSIRMDAPPIVSPESPPTKTVLATMKKVVDSMWPGAPLVPTMATGFSDDRQTRNAGMPSYDLSGLWMDPSENRAHGRDERIPVRAFDESVEYTYRLVKAVAAKGSLR
jgi:acetylornithine deacetylase/succinyl-diaminopimelate desuccinylase-like protein